MRTAQSNSLVIFDILEIKNSLLFKDSYYSEINECFFNAIIKVFNKTTFTNMFDTKNYLNNLIKNDFYCLVAELCLRDLYPFENLTIFLKLHQKAITQLKKLYS